MLNNKLKRLESDSFFFLKRAQLNLLFLLKKKLLPTRQFNKKVDLLMLNLILPINFQQKKNIETTKYQKSTNLVKWFQLVKAFFSKNINEKTYL
jgi:trehalose/maltose hydrolase-like predicted phosphorylase